MRGDDCVKVAKYTRCRPTGADAWRASAIDRQMTGHGATPIHVRACQVNVIFVDKFQNTPCNQCFTKPTSRSILRAMRLPSILFACLVFASSPHASADGALDLASFDAPRGGSIAELVVRGLSYVGIPYRFGGQSRDTGLDCSALIQRIYHEALGFAIPRTTREQAQLGQSVELNGLKAGDLIFFNTRWRAYSHVGMYLGGDRFLHAPSSGGEVRVEQLRTPYWVEHFSGGRRILPQRASVSDVAIADTPMLVDASTPADVPANRSPLAGFRSGIYSP